MAPPALPQLVARGDQAALLNPATGKVEWGPLAEAGQRLDMGYLPASMSDVRHDQLAAKFDSPLLAAGAALARGASAGLSDVALTKLAGVDPATLRNLREFNPMASFAGDVAGIVGGTLIPGGPLAQIGRLGRGAGTAVTAALGGAERVLPRLAGTVARGVTEGTLLSAGMTASNLALADGTLSGDRIANELKAHLKSGAMIGGGISLGGALLGGAARAVVRGGRALSQRLVSPEYQQLVQQRTTLEGALQTMQEGPLAQRLAVAEADKAARLVELEKLGLPTIEEKLAASKMAERELRSAMGGLRVTGESLSKEGSILRQQIGAISRGRKGELPSLYAAARKRAIPGEVPPAPAAEVAPVASVGPELEALESLLARGETVIGEKIASKAARSTRAELYAHFGEKLPGKGRPSSAMARNEAGMLERLRAEVEDLRVRAAAGPAPAPNPSAVAGAAKPPSVFRPEDQAAIDAMKAQLGEYRTRASELLGQRKQMEERMRGLAASRVEQEGTTRALMEQHAALSKAAAAQKTAIAAMEKEAAEVSREIARETARVTKQLEAVNGRLQQQHAGLLDRLVESTAARGMGIGRLGFFGGGMMAGGGVVGGALSALIGPPLMRAMTRWMTPWLRRAGETTATTAATLRSPAAALLTAAPTLATTAAVRFSLSDKEAKGALDYARAVDPSRMQSDLQAEAAKRGLPPDLVAEAIDKPVAALRFLQDAAAAASGAANTVTPGAMYGFVQALGAVTAPHVLVEQMMQGRPISREMVAAWQALHPRELSEVRQLLAMAAVEAKARGMAIPPNMRRAMTALGAPSQPLYNGPTIGAMRAPQEQQQGPLRQPRTPGGKFARSMMSEGSRLSTR